MTRYSLLIHTDQPEYVAACYDNTGSGIYTTLNPDDACSWVLFETACKVAKHVQKVMGVSVSLRAVSN